MPRRLAAQAIVLPLLIGALSTTPARAQWLQNGVPVCVAGPTIHPAIIQNASGALIFWMDSRPSSGTSHVYGQSLDGAGVPHWTTNGVLISSASKQQFAPAVVGDGLGGAFVAYAETAFLTLKSVVLQHVNSAGVPLWGDGITLCALDANSPKILSDFRLASAGALGAIVAWQDGRSSTNNIYLQAVNGAGTLRFAADGIPVTSAPGVQDEFTLVSDFVRNAAGYNGAILAWTDHRNASHDIYAQRINASGAASWTFDGAPVCAFTEDQDTPLAIPLGSGQATIAWKDGRNGALNDDIYAQRMGTSPAWLTDGLPVCRATDNQAPESILGDGLGGAIVAWRDRRTSTYEAMAQRIDGSGAPLWLVDGVTVTTGFGVAQPPSLVPGPPQGAILLWSDFRGSDQDLYAQAIDGNGSPLWPAGGVPLCRATGTPSEYQGVTDGAGGAIVTWADTRSGDMHIYANRVNGTGGVVGVRSNPLERVQFLPSHPNPTTRSIRWRIELPAPASVSAHVVGVDGRLIRVVADGATFPPGGHDLDWDGTDATGARVPNGVYFIRTRASDVTGTSRVLLIR